MTATQAVQNWFARQNPHRVAVVVGLLMGVAAGLVGLLAVVFSPIAALAAVLGIVAGLIVLADIQLALYAMIAVLMLLPFGTLPFRIGITPTFLDLTMGAFVAVYAAEWMTGQRRGLQLTPVHALITLYVMWLVFAFLLGLQYGMPTSTTLRQLAETLLSIGLVFILVDFLRKPLLLRRVVLVIAAFLTLQALLAITLYALPDRLAESLLLRLARIGYPDGGVIRYIESNPALGERAIGTWVDPNTLGGLLTVGAAMLTPQLFAARPLIRHRWLTWSAFGLTALALFLTSSRASFLALAVGLFCIVLLRYRQYLPLLIVGGLAFVSLPQTQRYIGRVFEAFQGADLATQMRIGEWTDALELIQRYPIAGIGFTGTPFRNLYTDVANMYLIMANQIGLVGVAFFLLAMAGVFVYAWRAWQLARANPELEAIHLGFHIALLVALLNAVADLYFFRLDFHASITWFWLVVALALASSRLILRGDSPLSKAG